MLFTGRDALAGAAGRGQSVLHADPGLARGFHLVGHGQAGLDGAGQVAQGDLAGGGAAAGHQAARGRAQGRVAAAVAVGRVAGDRGAGRGMSDQAGLHRVGAVTGA